MSHVVDVFDQDDEGFTIVQCMCGLPLGPFPDDETAIDALMEHAFLEGQASVTG